MREADRDTRKLEESVSREASRFDRARDRTGALAMIAHWSALGLGFALPLVGGAYLGRFLDERAGGYSMRWTLSLIFLGILIGAVNAYLVMRE